MEPLKRLERNLVKQGNIIELYEDTIETTDGIVQKYDFIRHKGAAAVLPVLADGRVMLVRQYRNALDRFTLEIPAGGRNGEEEPMESCAARELEEETGYRSEHLELLLSLRTTVAFCNEQIDVFLATDLEKTQQHLDEGEYVEVVCYPIEELVRMVYDTTIQDSKTVAAIMAYYVKTLEGKKNA